MIYDNMSNADYHKIDSENFSVSSSQLKDMLADPEVFYRKYITREVEKESAPAFDIGTFFHTAVLEPEKLNTECVVYSGVRRGEKWEAFKEANKHKAIIINTEYENAKKIITAVQNSNVAMGLLSGGKAEVSCFVKLYVSPYFVFTVINGENFILGRGGWEAYNKDLPQTVEITAKVRADYIKPECSEVSDLKSTSGNTKDMFEMKRKVSLYGYDMSAAFYLDMFSAGYGKQFSKFHWIFASKDIGNCQCYTAGVKNIMIGRAKWSKAILDLASFVKSGWKFEEKLEVLEANVYEQEWIAPKGEELL
jgi:hypothetical protein